MLDAVSHNAVELGGLFWLLLDHDRPLSKSGRADAIKVARKLKEMGWIPELILSRFQRLSSIMFIENLIFLIVCLIFDVFLGTFLFVHIVFVCAKSNKGFSRLQKLIFEA